MKKLKKKTDSNPTVNVKAENKKAFSVPKESEIKKWTNDDFEKIIAELTKEQRTLIMTRKEYALLKEVIEETVTDNVTESTEVGKTQSAENPDKIRENNSGVNSPFCTEKEVDDTTKEKSFLYSLDVQKANNIADSIASFKMLQTDKICLNIGLDTEFQSFKNESGTYRLVLSVQMSLIIGSKLFRYFFLIAPDYQLVTNNGGMVSLKYCLADILFDLKKNHNIGFPLVLKKNILYKETNSSKWLDFSKMTKNNQVIPITLICHSGKADITVFRRTQRDINLFPKLLEVQGGWATKEAVKFKVENDSNYNYYWLINLSIRDTLCLSPAGHKSLETLGNLIDRPKLELPDNTINFMSEFAIKEPLTFYEYAVNDSDIVVSFCSELFLCNHQVPITLSSAAASSMYESIKEYFKIEKKSDFDRIYRGLELADDGKSISSDEKLKYLKSTRYVPIRDNPDAKLISSYFEETYSGGFNTSFNIGWITEPTTDFDLKNAYPTAMANIIDIDCGKPVQDLPKNEKITLNQITNPLIPIVAVGNFDFPDDCYCPNIPVPTCEGLKIYPLHGENIYMSGPDIYLALQLGAKITIHRGFICQTLEKDGKPSQCLAQAVANLVKDRRKAKKVYKDNSLFEYCLKTMVSSCYGKIAQNVSPKTRYDAEHNKHVSAEPSSVTSPYHATYTTALVRCMLIACINQLHDMGYRIYSVTTDGFISNAPIDVVRGLDAFGFSQIFQNGRYILNQTHEDCDANQVWEPKHFNDTFLNITTRGNVAVNDDGVLAHNSYVTGEEKDSRADRDSFLIAVLSRNGKLACTTQEWTNFSDIVENKKDFCVNEKTRNLSMNFDYKRCPIIETAVDVPVSYTSVDQKAHVDTIIANFDTRPYKDVDEFARYRKTMENGEFVKTKKDLERVKMKSTCDYSGYIGKNLSRKQLLSLIKDYRAGKCSIPQLDGLKQKEAVEEINSWGIAPFTISDWKNCGRKERQKHSLPSELTKETYDHIMEM